MIERLNLLGIHNLTRGSAGDGGRGVAGGLGGGLGGGHGRRELGEGVAEGLDVHRRLEAVDERAGLEVGGERSARDGEGRLGRDLGHVRGQEELRRHSLMLDEWMEGWREGGFGALVSRLTGVPPTIAHICKTSPSGPGEA